MKAASHPYTRLFDTDLVAEHDRYKCVICGKEIRRRPKGARISHAQMHERRDEAYAELTPGPGYNEEWFAGTPASDNHRVIRRRVQ